MTVRLVAALRKVQLPARGLWLDLYPILQAGEPYGTMELSCEELAGEINVSVARVRQAMWELFEAGLLSRQKDGMVRCALMIDERRNIALREEMKAAFAQWNRSDNRKAVR